MCLKNPAKVKHDDDDHDDDDDDDLDVSIHGQIALNLQTHGGSMVLVCVPTKLGDYWDKCR
jgi:hypothetical protein